MARIHKINFRYSPQRIHNIDILEDVGNNEFQLWVDDEVFNLTEEERETLVEIFYSFQTLNELGIKTELEHDEDIQKFFKKMIDDRLSSIEEEDFFTAINTQLDINKNTNPNFKQEILSIYNQIKKATSLGQKELKERSTNIAVSLICAKVCETIYANHGFIRYETLQDILKRVQQTKAQIYEKKLAQFPFTIPTIVNKKTKEAEDFKRDGEEYYNPFQEILDAKNTNLFQEFIVIHYDKRSDKVKEAEEKARDPIVFGVLRGDMANRGILIKPTAQLIYITDWKDKYCNLTLEEFVKRANEVKIDVSTLNPNNAKKLTEELVKSLIEEIEDGMPETKALKKVLQDEGILSHSILTKLKKQISL